MLQHAARSKTDLTFFSADPRNGIFTHTVHGRSKLVGISSIDRETQLHLFLGLFFFTGITVIYLDTSILPSSLSIKGFLGSLRHERIGTRQDRPKPQGSGKQIRTARGKRERKKVRLC